MNQELNHDEAVEEMAVSQTDADTGPAEEQTTETAEESKADETSTPVVDESQDEDAPAPAEDPLRDDGEDEDEPDASDTEGLVKNLRRKNRENSRLRARAKEAELKALKFEVAAEAGLTLTLAARLQGSTRQDLLEDAGALIELLGARKMSLNRQPTDRSPRGEIENAAFDAKSVVARALRR